MIKYKFKVVEPLSLCKINYTRVARGECTGIIVVHSYKPRAPAQEPGAVRLSPTLPRAVVIIALIIAIAIITGLRHLNKRIIMSIIIVCIRHQACIVV